MDKIFPTLIGNDALKRSVGVDIRAHRSSHAYIIEGVSGSGKHTVARLIAASLSCEHRDDAAYTLPCMECQSCKKIMRGISPDVVTVGTGDKASVGVDEIRRIREGLYVTPNDSDTRTYIIESAEKMTPQAQNALLLTIEEPPPFVVFLLLSEDSSKLLETVKSRAQRIRCESFSPTRVGKYLRSLPNGEALYRKSPERFAAAASLCEGSLGRAEQLLSASEADSLLKAAEGAAGLVEGLVGTQLTPLMPYFAAVGKKSDEARRLLLLADNALRDLCLLKSRDTAAQDEFRFFTDRARAELLCERLSYKKLFYIHDCICEALTKLDMNVSARTVLANLIFSCRSYRS